MPWSTRISANIAGLALVLLGAGAANAESGFRFDPPVELGTLDAATFDAERKRVGKAQVVIEELADGRVRMLSESGFTGGARTVMTAVFSRVEGAEKLRPVFQESRSFDAEGTALGILSIDHEKAVASCRRPDGELAGQQELPDGDRVANVTLSLLFQPLVRKEQDEISFQIFMCSGGSRLMNFVASLTPASRNGKKPPVLEVRYGPDFGVASMIARSFVPKLSVWFDPESHRWMAHRVPLYGKGPEVFVIRDGVPARWLGDD